MVYEFTELDERQQVGVGATCFVILASILITFISINKHGRQNPLVV